MVSDTAGRILPRHIYTWWWLSAMVLLRFWPSERFWVNRRIFLMHRSNVPGSHLYEVIVQSCAESDNATTRLS
jgi:hypothetical protein